MNAVRTRRRVVSTLGTSAVLALLLLGASSASAAVEWTLTAEHGPQNLTPGDADPTTPEAQYVFRAYNVGNLDTNNNYMVDVVLPPQLTATGFSWQGGSPVCSGLEVAGGIVSCRHAGNVANRVRPPGTITGKLPKPRGEAPPLFLDISVAGAASGSADVSAQVYGGNCGATPTLANAACARSPVALDPALVDAAQLPFGFRPIASPNDAFDAPVPTGGTGGTPVRQAGSHPFEMRVSFAPRLKFGIDPELGPYTEPVESIQTLETRLPAGLIGNPEATPRCEGRLLNEPGHGERGACPANTQVGTADLVLQDGISSNVSMTVPDVPVYNMVPPPGSVAALAVSFLARPVWITIELDPNDSHAVVATVERMTESLVPRRVDMTLWGVPGDPAHDWLRLDPDAPSANTAMNTPFTGAPIKPYLTLPAQCDTLAGSIRQRADSWENPGPFTPWDEGPPMQATGCDDPRFQFEPSISIEPTSHEAASPTGLEVELKVPQKDDAVADATDLYAQNGKDVAINTPPVRTSVTHLPPGMAVNPSVADGLTGCSLEQVGLDDNDDPDCPDSSKIGTVEIDSDLMPDTMRGFIYQARQGENPFGSLLSFYTVAQGDGLTIKLAAKVQADPETGQLTTTFSDNPQLTFSSYRLRFWGGERAPLVNPPTCGTFEGTGTVSSWNSSVPAVSVSDPVQITSGPNGAPCPDGLSGRPFAPGFDAKSVDPLAGAFSEFALEVTRADGSQELRGLEVALPPGVLAKLAGVPYCAEAALAAISAAPGTGLGERLSPSCPAASLVGHSDAAAGAGALPFHIPGNVYLTGPYKGAPLGLAVVTPIVAGPLDLGSIVVRAALHVDPVTAQARVVSDPIPDRIVAAGNGFPLNVRSVRVAMDRPGFTLNPTSCEEMAVGATLTSLQGAVAPLAERFQVGSCAALGFKPRLTMRLFGKANRGAHPRLRAELRMPDGNAGISRAAVTLPRATILDQGHIGTVCTRVQFAAQACPAGSIYGRARVFTPLLEQPLEGPVYLRSSNHTLPDLVADLRGQIGIELVGRIDSVRGRLRTTFETVPDAPFDKFVLSMRGGRKGLLQVSRNLCLGNHRATAKFGAHNGLLTDSRPRLRTSCDARHERRAKTAG